MADFQVVAVLVAVPPEAAPLLERTLLHPLLPARSRVDRSRVDHSREDHQCVDHSPGARPVLSFRPAA